MDVHDRNGCLRRDAADLTPDIMVENKVPNDQDPSLGKPLNVSTQSLQPGTGSRILSPSLT